LPQGSQESQRHPSQISPKEGDDGYKSPEVQRHVEGETETGLIQAQKILAEKQVP
jgi:hypothetical protein